MKTNKKYMDRLETIAFHLNRGEEFYNLWNENLQILKETNDKIIYARSSVLFELADLYSEDFKITWRIVPAKEGITMIEHLQQFFGLSYEEMLHLFCPGEQQPQQFGGDMLYFDSFPQDIADNMFIMLKRHGWVNKYKQE